MDWDEFNRLALAYRLASEPEAAALLEDLREWVSHTMAEDALEAIDADLRYSASASGD